MSVVSWAREGNSTFEVYTIGSYERDSREVKALLRDGCEQPGNLETPAAHQRAARQKMNEKPLRTAYELSDMIAEQATTLYGPWPTGMTLFVFDDAYGWTASISRPNSEADNLYRNCIIDLLAGLTAKYDLNVPNVSSDLFSSAPFDFKTYLRDPQTPRNSTWQKASNAATAKPKNPKRKRSR